MTTICPEWRLGARTQFDIQLKGRRVRRSFQDESRAHAFQDERSN